MTEFYYGENSFEINKQIELVKKQFADKYGSENIVVLDSTKTDQVLAEIVNTGLFSCNRLVILKNVFSNKTLIEKLPSVLKLIDEETELIVVDTKPDKRTKLYKALLYGKSREYKLPKNLSQFVENEAKSQGVKMDERAIEKLIEYSSGDVWRVSNEIAKLKVIKSEISEDDIEKYVEPSLEANAFQILDDIFGQRKKIALDKIKLLKQNEDPVRFFGLLSSQAYNLAVAKCGDKPSSVVAKEVGVHPYAMSKSYNIARRISEEEVMRIAKIISEVDIKIKSSKKEDLWDYIELAINKI